MSRRNEPHSLTRKIRPEHRLDESKWDVSGAASCSICSGVADEWAPRWSNFVLPFTSTKKRKRAYGTIQCCCFLNQARNAAS